jgi:hypothetical protein
VVWKLGLGQRGCVYQAATRYDSGYKKSDAKRMGGKKPMHLLLKGRAVGEIRGRHLKGRKMR